MDRDFIDTSSFFGEDEVDSDNSALELFTLEQPTLKPEDEKVTKHSLYIDENEDKNKEKTDTPVEPALREIGSMVKEYENWEGRVVSTEGTFIRARMFNTQRYYSPRVVRIDKSVFTTKGVKRELKVGDMFELTFRYVSVETLNKRNQVSINNRHIDTLRLIEPVALTRKEIDELTKQKLRKLSYLFKNGYPD